MEGIAALSLACNVVQIIGNGYKVIEVIAQVYKEGRTVDNAAIESTTKGLQDLCQAVELQANPVTTSEKQLHQTTQQCTAVAIDLIQELSKLKGNGSGWTKIKAGIATVRRKSKVESLRQRLSDCERAVNTNILATLRERDIASTIIQEQSFTDLDLTLQSFIVRVSQGQTRTVDLIKADNEVTRRLLLQTRDVLSSKIDSFDASKQRTQLLNSLRYPGMNSRLNQIEEASADTFDAFFEPSSHHQLARWFQEASGVLWIQGKAGSGKSTLMKYIAQSSKVIDLIKRKGRKVAILHHFFWLSGSPFQRNIHGLLCSLSYQLIEIINKVHSGDKFQPDDWSDRELEALILSALRSLVTDTTVIILLDALDEYDERFDRRKLLKLINELSCCASVCVSSRRESFWIKHLQYDAQVKLEDINDTAITTYIHSQFEELGFENFDNLILSLSSQAEGVFLWAHLAMKDVLRGLDSNATEDELQRRLNRLPQGIENLYEEMLARVKEDWPLVQQEAALLFSTALFFSRTPSFVGHTYIRSGYLYQYGVVAKCFPMGQVRQEDREVFKQECVRLKDRITFVCAGMLEVGEADEYNRVNPLPSIMFSTVEFTHRTARDFLLDVPFGRSLVEIESWDTVAVLCDLIAVEEYIYCFGLRKMGWYSIQEILCTIVWVQEMLNLNDSDCLKPITNARNLLTTSLPLQARSPRKSIDFVHKKEYVLDNMFATSFSIDFLGLTLEAGTICYFNSLCLMPENLTVHYMEYLLFCAAATYSTRIHHYDLQKWTDSYLDVWKVVRQHGVSGKFPFWLSYYWRSSQIHPDMMLRYTAHELLLMHTQRAAQLRSSNELARCLQKLDKSGVDANDIYSCYISTHTSWIAFDATTTDHSAKILYVEGNLRFWLGLIYSFVDLPQLPRPTDFENYQAVAPFRRLRFIMSEGGTRGVPLLIKNRLVAGTEDGEILLQLWESSIRPSWQSLDTPFSDQDKERLDQEGTRLLHSVSGWLRTNAQTSPELQELVKSDGDTMYFQDYLKYEGILRDKSAADADIPVFKEP